MLLSQFVISFSHSHEAYTIGFSTPFLKACEITALMPYDRPNTKEDSHHDELTPL